MTLTETTSLGLCGASQPGGGGTAKVSQGVPLSALVDVSLPKTAWLVHRNAGVSRCIALAHRLVLCVLARADAAKVANAVVRAVAVQVVDLIGPFAVVHGKGNAVREQVLPLKPSAPVSLDVNSRKGGLSGAVSSYDPRAGIVRKGGLQFFNHATSYRKVEVV